MDKNKIIWAKWFLGTMILFILFLLLFWEAPKPTEIEYINCTVIMIKDISSNPLGSDKCIYYTNCGDMVKGCHYRSGENITIIK